MSYFISTKTFDGYSACFRQWRADGTHCKFLHGYGVSFTVEFEGELDHRNWVFDFGGMKRANTLIQGKTPTEFFNWLLDHTVLVAVDDPELETFYRLSKAGIIQLRVLESVGAERFAEYLGDVIDNFLSEETEGRVRVKSLTFKEHAKNSATYFPPK